MSSSLYVRSEFVDAVNAFSLPVSLTLNELKYAYSKLGFFSFFVFLIFYLSGSVKNRSGKKQSKRPKKKNNKNLRRKIQLNLAKVTEKVSVSNLVDRKVKKVSNKLKSKLMNEFSSKVLKSADLLKKSAHKKRKTCPSRMRRAETRAEKRMGKLGSYVHKYGCSGIYYERRNEEFMIFHKNDSSVGLTIQQALSGFENLPRTIRLDLLNRIYPVMSLLDFIHGRSIQERK